LQDVGPIFKKVLHGLPVHPYWFFIDSGACKHRFVFLHHDARRAGDARRNGSFDTCIGARVPDLLQYAPDQIGGLAADHLGYFAFQYSRLVSIITHGLRHDDLQGRDVLITSCAFGDVMPRVLNAAVKSGARQLVIADIIQNELDHARTKLGKFEARTVYRRDNAVAMQHPVPACMPT